MLAPKPKGWFHWVFVRYNRRLLRTWFAALRVRGLEHLSASVRAEHSLLVLGNHSSWWDGLVQGDLLDYTLGLDYHVMIEEAQVWAHPFFLKVGGFSINAGDPADVRRSLRFAVDLLARPGRVVSVFPQGQVVSAERAIECQRGVCVLLGRGRLPAHARVVLLTVHYGFWRNSRPELFVDVSPPLAPAELADITPAGLSQRLNNQTAAMRACVARMQPNEWSTLWIGRFDVLDGVRRQKVQDL